MRFNIKFIGFGGQGIQFASIVLSTAAALFDGKYATMSSNYSPEARGGRSHADVIISSEKIYYPGVVKPDILLIMSDEGYKSFSNTLHSDTIILVDESLVKVKPQKNVYGIPATKIAESLGLRIMANMVMLGLLVSVTDAVSYEAVKQAIRMLTPHKLRNLNLNAFKEGYKYGLKLLEKKLKN